MCHKSTSIVCIPYIAVYKACFSYLELGALQEGSAPPPIVYTYKLALILKFFTVGSLYRHVFRFQVCKCLFVV